MNRVLFSSKQDSWETPQDFFDQLDEEFRFTLDAAADEQNHKCDKYYTASVNGLVQDWEGETVFCNPPYGRHIGAWVEKAYFEGHKPETTVVLLIPSRTDTKYFHEYIWQKAEIRFIRGRLRFGESKNSAPFPSMLAIFRGPKK